MPDHLIIGDAHARPGISNRRFDWLGAAITALAPDVVVQMGDWFDLPALSSYDGSALTGSTRPKASFEGRRYRADLEAGWEALDRVHAHLQRAARKRPRRVALGGNHDHGRISRAVDNTPELSGTLGISDLRFQSWGWEYVPFLEPVVIDGICYQHYFTSGLMGRPTGGEDPATRIIKTQFTSCVAGHNHLYDQSHRIRADGSKLWAFTAGCYLDPDQWEDYAGPVNHLWDRGLLYLRGVEAGVPSEVRWISMPEVRRAYAS